MECQSLPKNEASEPSLSASRFNQRCGSLAASFADTVGLQIGEIAFAPEISNTSATMSLCGRASETISRNRGSAHPVVPLATLSDEVSLWVGYKESWEKYGNLQNFRFVEGGFTLHVGRPGELEKPQVLRNEWVGRRSRAFVDKAGHPHWQLDALESIRTSTPKPEVRFGDLASSSAVREFTSEIEPPDVTSLLLSLTIEKMHLASAAHWWRPPEVSVAHVPETVTELDRWVIGCVSYMRQEALRCRI